MHLSYPSPPPPIQDFPDFLSFIVPTTDNVLIIVDFNIHVCYLSKPLVRQFSDIVDSFNFTQSVCDATHTGMVTVDLILSMGLSISNVATEDNYIPDHKPLFFFFLSACFYI